MDYPRQKDFSCFDCKFYFPSVSEDFRGYCQKLAPRSAGAPSFGTPGVRGCYIVEPGITWCGVFEKWMGEPREKGTCPYVAQAPQALEVKTTDAAAVDKVAADVAAAAETATKAAEAATAAADKTEEAATTATKAATEAKKAATTAKNAAK